MDVSNETWRNARDQKMFRMLDPDEPAWLVQEEVHREKEVVFYEIVHRWQPGGWQRRRYTYDMISDVIHFRGAVNMDDSDITKIKVEQRLHHPALQ